jgi:hypothetical protein
VGYGYEGVETSLPAPGWPFPDLPAYSEVTEGLLRVSGDSLITTTLALRCQHPLPSGASCQLSGRRRIIYEGAISRIDDRRFAVVFTERYAVAFLSLRADSATLSYEIPPSAGGLAVAFEFQRRRR